MTPPSPPPSRPVPPPSGGRQGRLLAARAVAAALPGSGPGERLDRALDALLETAALEHPLAPRDRGLAREIALGTVRHLRLLDHLLRHCMTRGPLAPRQAMAWAILRTALYQARFLRVPARAAVHEAVELIKTVRAPGLAGFVNAILRRAVTLETEPLLTALADPLERLGVAHSHPDWLVRRWAGRTPEPTALEGLLETNNRQPPLTLRLNPLMGDPAITRRHLEEAGIPFHPCRLAPEGITVEAGGAVEELPGYGEGWFAVQDQAAQVVGRLLEPRAGERLLDACAAPGGKTAHLAALTGNRATIVALELQEQRLITLRRNLGRLGVQGVEVRQGDAARLPEGEGEGFHRILVDAPCSGTGVIRRHPDIKWRRSPRDLEELAALQTRILEGVADRVLPGGLLVYATCSLEPEENEARVAAFLDRHRGWETVPPPDWLPAAFRTPEGHFRSRPGQEGMDGFFAARLRRRSG